MSKKYSQFLPPGLAYIAQNINSKRNIMGSSGKDRAAWAKDLKLPKEHETIFFAGCGYQYSGALHSMMSFARTLDKSPVGAELPLNIAVLQQKAGIDLAGFYSKVTSKTKLTDSKPLVDAVKILRKMGIDFGYLGEEEPCCGGPLYYAGLKKDFQENAGQASYAFKSLGVKKIIGIVPSCTYTLRKLAWENRATFNLEITHFLEVVAKSIESMKLRFPQEVRVTYHDPCQLSRYLGIMEEPRRILRSIKGIELIETDWTNGQWSTCCGGGGGFEAVFPELSGILAENRARELAATGAQVIVTHCPGCIMQLREGLNKLKIGEIEVLDLVEVLAMSMELS